MIHDYESLLTSPQYRSHWADLSREERMAKDHDRFHRGSRLMRLAFEARDTLDSLTVLTPLQIAARAEDPNDPTNCCDPMDDDEITDADYVKIRDCVDAVVIFLGKNGAGELRAHDFID